jgi:hypothetical protein
MQMSLVVGLQATERLIRTYSLSVLATKIAEGLVYCIGYMVTAGGSV